MKRLLLSLMIVFSAYGTMGQCVPDGSISAPGIYPPAGSTVNPDSTVNLPMAVNGQMYDEVIQVKIPSDTSVVFAGTQVTANVDSFRLDFINNLPPGLSFDCENASCNWPGGTNGCVRIYGIPNSTSSTGQDYQLQVGIRAFLKIFAIPIDTLQSEDRFKIYLDPQVSVEEWTSADVKLYPNPSKGDIFVELGGLREQEVKWTCYDLSGRLIRSGSVHHMPGLAQKIQLGAPAKGLCLIQLATDRGVLTRRVTINE